MKSIFKRYCLTYTYLSKYVKTSNEDKYHRGAKSFFGKWIPEWRHPLSEKKLAMKNEIYHTINVIGCECSVNSIDYDASDLIVALDRFDNNKTVTIRFKNVFAYRVTLEHFRIIEVMDGVTSHPLYEVSNSIYLNEVMATGMRMLYGSSLNVKHYAIKTTEHIVDVLTSEAYIIE